MEPAVRIRRRQTPYVTRQTLFTHITTREANQEMADDLFAAVTSGQVKIRIDQTFPLAQVREAHQALEARTDVMQV